MNFQENVLLAPYTTFQVGGPARYFFVAKTSDDIVPAIRSAKELGLNYFILGSGSNLVVSDKGFDGLVIKVEARSFKIDGIKVFADAGVRNDDLIVACAEAGLAGLESFSGIPGSIGGSVRGNAGAYGKEIKDFVKIVKALNADLEVVNLSDQECGFGYRESIFKRNPGLVILEVEFELSLGDKNEIKNKVEEILQARKSKYPDYPSSGCTFKNTKIKTENGKVFIGEIELDKKFVKLLPSKFLEWGTIPSAWVIEQLGLKGMRIGGAKVSEDHANFVVNLDQAKAEDVIMLISLIKGKARNNFGIQLEEEVQLVGF